MQEIIDITDDIYAELTKTGENEINLGILLALREAVRQGTPLPKGHGRLIDADEVKDAIYKCFEDIQFYDGTGYDIYSDSKESIDKIPTIIEADTKSEDK